MELKDRWSWKKNVWRFFYIYVLFFRFYFLKENLLRNFSCKNTLLNISHDRKGLFKFAYIFFFVIYNNYKGTFILLCETLIAQSGVLLNDLCESDLFKKMKLFLKKDFHLNFVKKVKCISVSLKHSFTYILKFCFYFQIY